MTLLPAIAMMPTHRPLLGGGVIVFAGDSLLLSKKLIRYVLLVLLVLIICQIVKLALMVTLFTLLGMAIVGLMIRLQLKKVRRRFSRRQHSQDI
ncbi:hypothetical protein [Celerinatantimonas yamalensis]|uniref:Uncharacterized protein n=1 Tax=Celerinatantimonas yamalensis TaxID=559956 RepID=A0ABW9G7K7_9GAMM